MISVLVFALGPQRSATPGEAVRTLSSLVAAVVEGVARDVALVSAPGSGELTKVADHAGCALIEASSPAAVIAAAARQCRSPDVLVVRVGVMIDRAFVDELCGILPVVALEERPPTYVLKSSETGLAGRVFPSLAHTVGVLAKRDRIAGSGATDLTGLVRGLRPIRLFQTRAWAGL